MEGPGTREGHRCTWAPAGDLTAEGRCARSLPASVSSALGTLCLHCPLCLGCLFPSFSASYSISALSSFSLCFGSYQIVTGCCTEPV